MKKIFAIFSFSLIILGVNAQTSTPFTKVAGKVASCKADISLSYSHIINETSKFNTLADVYGNYSIYVKPGDILRFSFLGFKTRFVEYQPGKFNSDICLLQDTILLKEVVALPYANYTEFKKKFLALKTEEKEYAIPGITLKERTTLHLLDNEKYLSSFYVARHSPITFLYYKFNRHAKSVLRYYEMENDKWNQIDIDKKYNREIVATLTGLKEEKLTRFMVWCNFNKDYLIAATDFEIALKVKEKYLLYCEKSENDKDSI